MIHRCIWPLTALVGLVAYAPSALAGGVVQLDFETEPLGTTFGALDDDVPGEIVLVQNGIAMSVENFFVGQFVGFNVATIGGRHTSYFLTTPLELNNISVRFDFTEVGFDVSTVTVEAMEFGGSNNFAVNDGPVHIVKSLTEIEALPLGPGIEATVEENIITLTGPISSFQIGGQELSVDNIIAVPEPASLILLALGGLALVGRRRVGAA